VQKAGVNMKNKCYVVVGPTASGKSSFAIRLAQKINGGIINADSQQVLKEIPTLTDRPTEADMSSCLHYLYGYKNCSDEMSSFSWCIDAAEKIKECIRKGNAPILVGGTGFYIQNLLEGHSTVPKTTINVNMSNDEMYDFMIKNDPECRISIKDTYRLTRAVSVIMETNKKMSWWHKQEKEKFIDNINFIKIFVWSEKGKYKITDRINDMFPSVEAEVREHQGKKELDKIIGFKEINSYLRGENTLEETKKLMYYRTCQYAKRQRTWFKHQMECDFTVETNDNVKIVI
jgi:tRNA dimethylallyltransferase